MFRLLRGARTMPIVLAGLFASLSQAATIGAFDFENDAPFSTTTPFTDTNNGISATFTSPSDPGAFTVEPGMFQALSGNVLAGTAGATELDVSFNQSLVAATFTFATSDFVTPGPLDLEALNNGVPVGNTTATGIVPAGFTFPEGEIAFEGTAFNQLVITTPQSPTFAIDNVNVAEAPEPSSLSLILIGLITAFAPVVIRRVRPTKHAASRLARTALAAGSAIGIAGAATPALLPLPAPSAPTNSVNGDFNPYGVAFVPATVPQDGILKPGAILVSNFNDFNNLQGRGTSIVQVDKSGATTAFFVNSSGATGMTGALGIFSDGLVLAGYEPSIDGTPATVMPGGIEVISRKGQLLLNITDPGIRGPWGLAIHEKGQGLASVFVSNVLNGTILRLDVQENGVSLAILNKTVIASGLAHRLDPAAFTLGPSGLAYDATHDILYFANSDDDNVYSLSGAGAATGSLGANIVYSDFTHLHGPLDLVLLATGHLLVADSDGSNIDPNQPSELVEFTPEGQFVAQYSLDPNNGGAFGLAVNYLGFSAFKIAAVDDNENVLKIWTETVN